MSKKSVALWLAAALLCIAGITVFLLLRGVEVNNPEAVIYLDGELHATLPLDEDTELTVKGRYGSNTIRIENGRVSVISADCPDKVCVSSGAISGGAVPIICLPHRLEIRIISAEKDDIDAQIR